MNADDKLFINIIDATPLVSIDLILQNTNDEILLGKRVNRPAQGSWFVPGGCIKKNETIMDAMKRIALNELGIDIADHNVKLLGVFDHIYEDNYFGIDSVNTHYVVLAYMVKVQDDLEVITDNQHSEIKWWPVEKLMHTSDVHENTKVYFLSRHNNGNQP